ncbi:methyltransferase [Aliihoeflea sp. 2WW]|uniref:class I SAM-dependent methyltransferase n=1 Tax=Aliihoeflea sp. 2WW TaxID=1381123 RepID=UPI0004BB4B99|nr:methyltransferase [Aliihoeflea sp. 2WW]
MGGSLPDGRIQENPVKDRRDFIRANTAPIAPPHVPEIRLHLADEAHELWHRTEAELEAIGLEPPFWAFAWAGGQGLARYVLDHPETVAAKRVVDFATGSGLVAIAAMKAGAASVLASDIDPFCAAAVALNATANGVTVETTDRDLVGETPGCDVLLAGDVFYDRAFAERLVPWLRELAAAGITVLVGDPGRAYLPRDRLAELARYEVPVTRILEDAEVKRTTVWQFV